jgi:hypothetical protein
VKGRYLALGVVVVAGTAAVLAHRWAHRNAAAIGLCSVLLDDDYLRCAVATMAVWRQGFRRVGGRWCGPMGGAR